MNSGVGMVNSLIEKWSVRCEGSYWFRRSEMGGLLILGGKSTIMVFEVDIGSFFFYFSLLR